MIYSQRILIFGGSGSLGAALTRKFLSNSNHVVIFSRDETKHWHMKHDFSLNSNLEFIVGSVADRAAVRAAIARSKPSIIINASALKHIDVCEVNIDESIKTNITGTQNIVQSIAEIEPEQLQTVLFVSTDKACNPINNYGMCKAVSETIMVERALKYPKYKFVTTRYGNVLTSRGSIIPLLHKLGRDSRAPHFTLTDERMTRFIMTLDQSVSLIEYTIQNATSGDIVVPVLHSMRIKDLVEIFGDLYGKEVKVVGIRPGEKLTESLYNESQAVRAEEKNGYIHIRSQLRAAGAPPNVPHANYDSDMNVLSLEELRDYLEQLGLLRV